MAEPDIRAALADAATELREIHALAATIAGRADSLLARVAAALDRGTLSTLSAPPAPPSEHRRAHRPGVPAKNAADPELQAFIAARIDRLTFQQIAADIAAAFPPARRVGKSAIYDWWTKRQRRPKPQPPLISKSRQLSDGTA